MIGGAIKIIIWIIILVIIAAFVFGWSLFDLGDLDQLKAKDILLGVFSEPQAPDIQGDIISGSIKARSIKGNINGGEEIEADVLYGDINNGSDIDLDAMVGNINGGENIEVDTLIGDVNDGEGIHIDTLVGEDNSDSDTVTIERIIEKETIVKEIC